jgi:hypothetical protein
VVGTAIRSGTGMPTEGKLEVIVKFNQLPTEVTRDKNGWVSFAIDCGPGLMVQFHARPKIFMKLEQAQKDQHPP